MTWIIEVVVVGVLIYFMIGGYRALKERKRLDRLEEEMEAKFKASQEARRAFDAEVARLRGFESLDDIFAEKGKTDPRFRFTKKGT